VIANACTQRGCTSNRRVDASYLSRRADAPQEFIIWSQTSGTPILPDVPERSVW